MPATPAAYSKGRGWGMVSDHGQGGPTADGGFDPWKVYETLAAILSQRAGVEVRLTGLTKDGQPLERGESSACGPLHISTHAPREGNDP